MLLTFLFAILSSCGASSIDRDFTTPEEARAAIQELASRFQAQKNPRALFSGIYAITIDATAKKLNQFENPKWVSALIVNYANIYRRTIWKELNGRRRELPRTWQLTFDYEDQSGWSADLDVVYSVHVHIVRDLVEALYATPANYKSASIRRDFYKITDVLKGAMPKIWKVYERYYFLFPGIDILAENVFTDWIARQRDYAWRAHFANLHYSPAQQRGFLGRIDRWAYDGAVNRGVWLALD